MASGHSEKKPYRGAPASFRRIYREDYVRELNVPGMGQHIFQAFKMIFLNWKIFLPLLLIVVVVMAGLLGFLNLADYKDAGVMVVVSAVILTVWLITIFVLRQRMAKNKIGLRDALYNAMTPFLSSLVVLVVVAIQAVPVILVIIAYASAVETHFLDTPFYAFLFLTFAGLMILLTSYLWSGSLIALTAVSAPGLYPLEALKAANEMMIGRRIKFVLRIIALLIVLFVMWAILIWPMAMWVGESPALAVMLMTVGCFSVMYIASYLYLYYRWMLDAN